MKFLLRFLLLIWLLIFSQLAAAHQVWTMANDVLFAGNNGIDLTEIEIKKIKSFVKNSHDRSIRVFIIVGHADTPEINQMPLSLARARRVEQLFIQFGMKSRFIFTEAKAAMDPAYNSPNMRNQRVEIEAIAEH